jgi:hypothetical protein
MEEYNWNCIESDLAGSNWIMFIVKLGCCMAYFIIDQKAGEMPEWHHGVTGDWHHKWRGGAEWIGSFGV